MVVYLSLGQKKEKKHRLLVWVVPEINLLCIC